MRNFFCAFVVMWVMPLVSAYAVTEAHAIRSYPHRGADKVNVLTQIGISYNAVVDSSASEAGSISVTGSKNGTYSGSLTLSLDRKTLIFNPSHPFLGGETVSVFARSLQLDGGGWTAPETFTFTTASIPAPAGITNVEKSEQLLSIPDTGALPKITVTKNVHPYPGQIYLANFGDPSGNAYRIKVNTDGTIAYAKSNGNHYCTDFKAHPNGTYTWVDYSRGFVFIADTSDKVIDSLSGANGFPVDVHEFQYTPEGNYIFIADNNVVTDMSQVGGKTNAVVIYPVIQEFDKKHNLIFEWNSKDYFNVFDGTHQSYQQQTIDFCHMNSIEFDADSNLIVSDRNMDEVTKIDRSTGTIIWRLGGNNNIFTFKDDKYGFSGQHHFRRLPNGNFTGFDDGNFRPGPLPFSRAIEYKLDQGNLIATLVWEFRHVPDRFASGMGSVQRLPNGNTLIGWGWADTVGVTEVDPQGNTQFELNYGTGTHSYRVYKFDTNYIYSSSHTGLISAADLDFGSVPMGDTIWKPLQIKNLGSYPFNLKSSYLLSDMANFTVDPKTNFPLEIKAGGSGTVYIYFHPQAVRTYSDSIIWSTDITDNQSTVKAKDRSFLTGQGTQNMGVKSPDEVHTFTIIPNPASGNFVTIACSSLEHIRTVKIYDILGKEVYGNDVLRPEKFQIPIQDLPEGIYYLKINTSDGSSFTHSFSRVKK